MCAFVCVRECECVFLFFLWQTCLSAGSQVITNHRHSAEAEHLGMEGERGRPEDG